MSVFPAASKKHVPEPWSRLMFEPVGFQLFFINGRLFRCSCVNSIYYFTICLQFSPVIDFYPEDFKLDLNGKKFAWQGVALLPFVDETRLHKALAPLYPLLTDDEGTFEVTLEVLILFLLRD